jgi:BlaI family penicillinase repressor
MTANHLKAPNISASEWTVMESLWENSPQTASAVAKTLHEATGWAENTVRTLLTRLVEKGALVFVDPGVQPKRYAPAVKRELCVQAESASFLDRIFRGAANPLLVHFARNARLTEEEARELKKLLDQSIQGTSPRK